LRSYGDDDSNAHEEDEDFDQIYCILSYPLFAVYCKDSDNSEVQLSNLFNRTTCIVHTSDASVAPNWSMVSISSANLFAEDKLHIDDGSTRPSLEIETEHIPMLEDTPNIPIRFSPSRNNKSLISTLSFSNNARFLAIIVKHLSTLSEDSNLYHMDSNDNDNEVVIHLRIFDTAQLLNSHQNHDSNSFYNQADYFDTCSFKYPFVDVLLDTVTDATKCTYDLSWRPFVHILNDHPASTPSNTQSDILCIHALHLNSIRLYEVTENIEYSVSAYCYYIYFSDLIQLIV